MFFQKNGGYWRNLRGIFAKNGPARPSSLKFAGRNGPARFVKPGVYNPAADYDGITKTRLAHNSIWIPGISLINLYDLKNPIEYLNKPLVQYNGGVRWLRQYSTRFGNFFNSNTSGLSLWNEGGFEVILGQNFS